jgi:hypothetical protein
MRHGQRVAQMQIVNPFLAELGNIIDQS